jgi:protocatechuate 4,5-dioxygenase beta chain
MLVDHAFTLPMALLWPSQDWPVQVVPVCINTVQFPVPSARRCWKLGEAIGQAVRAWDSDKRVLILGTGGLSHQLEGERAGFINKPFDLAFMDSLTTDPQWATQWNSAELVEKAGTQGIELLMWLAARGALGDGARAAPQLPHPHLQHRGRPDGDGPGGLRPRRPAHPTRQTLSMLVPPGVPMGSPQVMA